MLPGRILSSLFHSFTDCQPNHTNLDLKERPEHAVRPMFDLKDNCHTVVEETVMECNLLYFCTHVGLLTITNHAWSLDLNGTLQSALVCSTVNIRIQNRSIVVCSSDNFG